MRRQRAMAGYAAGGALFSELWSDHIDSVYHRLGLNQFHSYLVGNTVHPGPGLNALSRFAAPGMYRDIHTALVPFFRDSRVFGGSGRIVMLVSDLEPDNPGTDPNCASRGSLGCLQQTINHLADNGWQFWIIGFVNRYVGNRSYFRVTKNGVLEEASNSLKGQSVPVYIVVGAQDYQQGATFVTTLLRELSASPLVQHSALRSLQLTGFSRPPAEIHFERQVAEVFQSNRNGTRIVPRNRGQIALRLAEGHDGSKSLHLKIYNDVHQVSFNLPIFIPAQAAMGIGFPDIKWRFGMRSIDAPPTVHIQLREALYLSTQPHRTPTLEIDLLPGFLQGVGRSKDSVLRIKLTAKVDEDIERLIPFADWSYHKPGDVNYEMKTFRTHELLGSIVRHDVEKLQTSTAVAEIEIHFRHN